MALSSIAPAAADTAQKSAAFRSHLGQLHRRPIMARTFAALVRRASVPMAPQLRFGFRSFLVLGVLAWIHCRAETLTSPEPGLLFYLSGEQQLTADFAASG